MNAIRLKTEYLKNPIGIDEPLKEQEFSADRLRAQAAGTVAIVYSFCCFMVFIIETFMPR